MLQFWSLSIPKKGGKVKSQFNVFWHEQLHQKLFLDSTSHLSCTITIFNFSTTWSEIRGFAEHPLHSTNCNFDAQILTIKLKCEHFRRRKFHHEQWKWIRNREEIFQDCSKKWTRTISLKWRNFNFFCNSFALHATILCYWLCALIDFFFSGKNSKRCSESLFCLLLSCLGQRWAKANKLVRRIAVILILLWLVELVSRNMKILC